MKKEEIRREAIKLRFKYKSYARIQKIIAKHLFSETSEFYKEFKKMKYTEAKLLEGITPVTIDIFGTKTVLIMNYKEPISCILIQDENTAQSFRQFFYQLWKIAK